MECKALTQQQIADFNLSDRSGSNKTLIGQAVPMAITDYYTNLIEVQKTIPDYLKMLKAFGIDEILGHGTITGWRHFRCSRGHNYFYPEAQVERFNPYYLWTSVRVAASKSMRKLEGLEDLKNVYDIVLTYPEEVSKLAIDDMDIETKCHECFKDFVKRLSLLVYHCEVPGKNGLKLKACQLGLSENLHLWKSEEPTRPHLHHHVLLLDIYEKEWKGKYKTIKIKRKNNIGQGEWIETKRVKDCPKGRIYSRRFLSRGKGGTWEEGDLSKKIKLAWADCVNTHFGTSYRTLDVHNSVVSIDRDRARLLHKLKYKKRTPLFDLAEFYRRNEFKALGLYPKFMFKLLAYKNKTHCFGYWPRLLCTLVSREIVSREIKKYNCHCPICGSVSEDIGLEGLPLDVKFVYIDRKGRPWEVL